MSSKIRVNTPGYYYAFAHGGAIILYTLFLKDKGKKVYCWGIRIAFLILLLLWLSADAAPQIMFLPAMAVTISLLFGILKLTCDLENVKALYYCARSFILGEFTASLGWQMYYYFRQWVPERARPAANIIFIIVIYGVIFLTVLFLEHTFAREDSKIIITGKDLFFVIAIVAIAFAVSNISYLYSHTPFSSGFPFEVFIIRTLADFGGVALLYAYHIQLVRLQNRFETKTLQNIIEMQYANYQMLDESIELVNEKYHDLKHQIGIIRSGVMSDTEVIHSLDQVEQEIKYYEAQNKTGNKVLDTILTSKSLYCQKHRIQLSCVADGAALDFMEMMDISALFGNILDNAIESSEKIEDPKKRVICLVVVVQKGFLRIRAENYFLGNIEIRDGVPVTTKKDKGYHGYGIKSIKSIAKKYGGSVTIETKGNWFELRILFPIENNKVDDKA